MEIDDGACSSSEDEGTAVGATPTAHPHTAEIKIDMGSEKSAAIVARTLKVDKEPSRSNAIRSFEVDGANLIIRVASVDRRSLQKSIANIFDMCELVKSTIDLVEKKSWVQTAPVSKKMKLSS